MAVETAFCVGVSYAWAPQTPGHGSETVLQSNEGPNFLLLCHCQVRRAISFAEHLTNLLLLQHWLRSTSWIYAELYI